MLHQSTFRPKQQRPEWLPSPGSRYTTFQELSCVGTFRTNPVLQFTTKPHCVSCPLIGGCSSQESPTHSRYLEHWMFERDISGLASFNLKALNLGQFASDPRLIEPIRDLKIMAKIP